MELNDLATPGVACPVTASGARSIDPGVYDVTFNGRKRSIAEAAGIVAKESGRNSTLYRIRVLELAPIRIRLEPIRLVDSRIKSTVVGLPTNHFRKSRLYGRQSHSGTEQDVQDSRSVISNRSRSGLHSVVTRPSGRQKVIQSFNASQTFGDAWLFIAEPTAPERETVEMTPPTGGRTEVVVFY